MTRQKEGLFAYSKRTRQKNERGDRKGESNDSPEIPDRRRHQTSTSFRGNRRRRSRKKEKKKKRRRKNPT